MRLIEEILNECHLIHVESVIYVQSHVLYVNILDVSKIFSCSSILFYF